MRRSVAFLAATGALLAAMPAGGQDREPLAPADRLAEWMVALSGTWSGPKMTREQVLVGP